MNGQSKKHQHQIIQYELQSYYSYPETSFLTEHFDWQTEQISLGSQMLALQLLWRRTRWQSIAAAPMGFRVFGGFCCICFDFRCEFWQLFSRGPREDGHCPFLNFCGSLYDVSAIPSNRGSGVHHWAHCLHKQPADYAVWSCTASRSQASGPKAAADETPGLQSRSETEERRHRPVVPVIVMGNLRSLGNTTDELAALIYTQREYRECSVLCFTETCSTHTSRTTAWRYPASALFGQIGTWPEAERRKEEGLHCCNCTL